jgi:crotonobetainyl-CoA:carnitine CoA-transferase CaiB-like acyl-CoA transferase
MPGPAFGDVQAGMNLAGGVLGALYHRERTGEALTVDSSLLASGLWAMQASIAASSVTGLEQLARPDTKRPRNPLTHQYQTADGRFVALAMLQADRYWVDFCTRIERVDLLQDERFSDLSARTTNAEACARELSDTFRRRPLIEWVEVLSQMPGQWSTVSTIGEAAMDKQAIANGYIQSIDFGGPRSLRLVRVPVQYDGKAGPLNRAPEPASNTEDVLLQMGITWDEIAALKSDRIIS